MYSNSLICDILDYIDSFLYTKFTIDDLEKKFYYNRYYIMKLFKQELGITIFDYINKLRINSSINEINNTNHLLISVALNNGFYSLEYFSEIFKKEIGMSPRNYLKAYKNQRLYGDEILIATNAIVKIRKIINNTIIYKSKRKRDIMPVKKLSIFK